MRSIRHCILAACVLLAFHHCPGAARKLLQPSEPEMAAVGGEANPPIQPTIYMRRKLSKEYDSADMVYHYKIADGHVPYMTVWKPHPETAQGMTFFPLSSWFVRSSGCYECVDDLDWAVGNRPFYLAGAAEEGVFANPVSFEWKYDDRHTGVDIDGSAFKVNCPAGYASLGDVWNRGRSAPSLDVVKCVRADLVEPCNKDSVTHCWDDEGSGGSNDVAVWRPYGAQPVDLGMTFVSGDTKPRWNKDTDLPRMMCLKQSAYAIVNW